MNNRKAKALRSMARKLTRGLPERTYYHDQRSYTRPDLPHSTIRLGDCTRAEYKRLKAAYKRS